MGHARMQEMDYFDFKRELENAVKNGTRIEPTEKEKWRSYLKEHQILEASAMAHGRGQAENVSAVVIAEGPWQGFYVYSNDDAVCLRFSLDGE